MSVVNPHRTTAFSKEDPVTLCRANDWKMLTDIDQQLILSPEIPGQTRSTTSESVYITTLQWEEAVEEVYESKTLC